MVEVGDVAIKIAGRDAGKLCAVVEVMNNNFVLIDGETRRRKCNVSHLEFLNKKVKVKKGASSDDVRKALKDAGFTVDETKKGKKKERKVKPKKLRKAKKAEDTVAKTKAVKKK